jgi:hypothetical protein
VAPGPVDTTQFRKECAENSEQPWLDTKATYDMASMNRHSGLTNARRTALASENWSRKITGQILNVDSGKQVKVLWMKDEC